MEWEKWIDLFAVTMMAKYFIAKNELTRPADEANPKVKALLGDMPEEAANKKVVSMMFLSLGEAGRDKTNVPRQIPRENNLVLTSSRNVTKL